MQMTGAASREADAAHRGEYEYAAASSENAFRVVQSPKKEPGAHLFINTRIPQNHLDGERTDPTRYRLAVGAGSLFSRESFSEVDMEASMDSEPLLYIKNYYIILKTLIF